MDGGGPSRALQVNEFEQALEALERLEKRPRETRKRGQWIAFCPVHDDRHHPNLGFREGERGQLVAKCWACPATIGEIREALGLTWERNDTLAEPQRIDPLPTEDDVQRWREALLTNDKVLAAVRNRRGWSLRTLSGYEVGLDGNSLTIPQRAVDGSLVQCVWYIPGAPQKEKNRALSGQGPKPLWPAPEQFLEDRVLWLVEGEPDALSACELGLRGVSVGGDNAWRQEWAERFTGRVVRVCFDCDPQGRRAGHRIVGELRALDIDAKYVDLDTIRSDKYDLTDFLLEALAEPDGLDQARKWLANVA